MVPIPPGSPIQSNSSFLVLRDAKVIFNGSVFDLVNSSDEYIREYIA
jgi:ABC-type transporter Mla maintaining outer membrane lipid asymmetry ATPase subunit MlaF